ncbi:MAG: DUF1846 domain-containing protein [Lachnospiraceae bacterium]|nr:DUF1846 domain-containing protein [Lachnospiraceae bacterium]
MKIGFDNEKYLKLQSEHIKERIEKYDNKLYLEFGGKLFDDFHAARVLPGFAADSKLQMLIQLTDVAEIVMVVSADDIIKNKIRADLGITYDNDVIRLIEEFRSCGLYVGSVVLTKYIDHRSITFFQNRLENMGLKVYHHYVIDGYPTNIPHIISEDGFGKNDYIETSRPLVVVTAPGPGSGKMSTCLSQLYHEHKHGVRAGYAKYETFPVWNLSLDHPVNLAYEAATADLNDINMIDPHHLKAYGETAVNYNRDVEIFPVLNAMFMKIYGESPYASPTDMGVNMAGNCIFDDNACRDASKQEIIRRYYQAINGVADGTRNQEEVGKIELLMSRENITKEDRPVVIPALERANATGAPAVSIELSDGTIITGKTGDLLGSSSAALLNALKYLAGIEHEKQIISPTAIEPIQQLKTQYLGSKNPRLHTNEVLIALSATAANNDDAALALSQLSKLKGCQVHSTVMLSDVDKNIFKRLDCELTCEAIRE